MNQELHKLLSKEVRVYSYIPKIQIAAILDDAIPHIKKLMDKGYTLQEIEEAIKLFYEEPWEE